MLLLLNIIGATQDALTVQYVCQPDGFRVAIAAAHKEYSTQRCVPSLFSSSSLFSLSKIRTSSITHMREAARKMFFCLLCFSVCSVRTCSIHGRMVYGCVLPILHCSHLLLSLSCLFYSSLWDCPLHSRHCRLRDPRYPVQRLQYGHTRNKPNANLVWQQYSNG